MPPFLWFLRSILRSKIKLLLRFDSHNLSKLTSNFKQKSHSRKLQAAARYAGRSSITLENALRATQWYRRLHDVYLLAAHIGINMKILLLVTLCRIAFCLCVVRYITSVKTNAMVLPTDRCLFSSNLVDFWWKYSEY